MIDYFAIALTHGLIALACWRLLTRPDLDDDSLGSEPAARPRPWLAPRDDDHMGEAEQGSGHG